MNKNNNYSASERGIITTNKTDKPTHNSSCFVTKRRQEATTKFGTKVLVEVMGSHLVAR